MSALLTPAVTAAVAPPRLAFDLPPEREAAEPPEARGLTRDSVRMLVARRAPGGGVPELTHSTFALLPTFLDPGDLIVVNTSGTIPAAVNGVAADGTEVAIHLSTRIDGPRWVVEPRRRDGGKSSGTRRWTGPPPPSPVHLGEGARLILEAPYLPSGARGAREGSRPAPRLWVARLELPQPVLTWLAVHGRPIRYGYVDRAWPITAYQNVYATEPGSAEMPSAGRPFTPEILTRLVAKGVGVTPLVLHTGVASLEADELPYPERVTVPVETAGRVNATREAGRRVVAVGTTVVRALETAAAADGTVAPYDGWTDVVVTPERGVVAVDGLLTGWHEPEASHLLMLEAVGGHRLLEDSYRASLAGGYLWHEFGDVHLILR